MLKTALIYGAMSGIAVIGVILSGLFLQGGMHGHGQSGIFNSEWFGYLVMILALSTIFVAVREHRNKKLGGVIKFLPALGMGLLISAIAGAAYVAAWELYLYATHYSFADTYANAIIAHAHARAAGGDVAKATAEANAFKQSYDNPLVRLPMTFLEIFPVGVLIALISAALLRNPKLLSARA